MKEGLSGKEYKKLLRSPTWFWGELKNTEFNLLSLFLVYLILFPVLCSLGQAVVFTASELAVASTDSVSLDALIPLSQAEHQRLFVFASFLSALSKVLGLIYLVIVLYLLAPLFGAKRSLSLSLKAVTFSTIPFVLFSLLCICFGTMVLALDIWGDFSPPKIAGLSTGLFIYVGILFVIAVLLIVAGVRVLTIFWSALRLGFELSRWRSLFLMLLLFVVGNILAWPTQLGLYEIMKRVPEYQTMKNRHVQAFQDSSVTEERISQLINQAAADASWQEAAAESQDPSRLKALTDLIADGHSVLAYGQVKEITPSGDVHYRLLLDHDPLVDISPSSRTPNRYDLLCPVEVLEGVKDKVLEQAKAGKERGMVVVAQITTLDEIKGDEEFSVFPDILAKGTCTHALFYGDRFGQGLWRKFKDQAIENTILGGYPIRIE